MKRIIWRLFGGITTLVILFVLLGWLGLRASLPTLDGEIIATGLTEVAMIEANSADH